MKAVTERLSSKFGKGFSLASLKRMRQFYLAFPRGSALAKPMLAYAHEEKGSTVLSLSRDMKATGTPVAMKARFPPLFAWSHYLAPIAAAIAISMDFVSVHGLYLV